MAKTICQIMTFNTKIHSFLLVKPSVRNVCKKKHSKKTLLKYIYIPIWKWKWIPIFMDFSYDKGDDNNVICIKIPLRIWYTAESDSIQSQDTLWKAWVSRDTLSEIYGILLPKLCWPTLRKNVLGIEKNFCDH